MSFELSSPSEQAPCFAWHHERMTFVQPLVARPTAPTKHAALTPADVYPELFTTRHVTRVFDDSKTFVDRHSEVLQRGEQHWDRPNSWAASQWMAIRGLADHGEHGLTQTIAPRWCDTVAAVCEHKATPVEKYALRQQEHEHSASAESSEYPLQDGFRWTNGVTRALPEAPPLHTAHGCASCSGAPMQR